MGRGRAKAKQTKVARELKYSSLNTDFDALQRELAGTGDSTDAVESDLDDEDDQDFDDEDADEDDDWAPSR